MKALNVLLAIVIVGILLFSCNKKNDYTRTLDKLDHLTAQDTILYMSTSECFGICAEKESVITGDKVLHYNGIRYADPMGKIQTKLSTADIQDLYQLAQKADFFNLDARYPKDRLIDAQLMRLGIRKDDSIRYVDFEVIAPDSIRNLFLDVDKWISTQAKKEIN